MVRRLLVIIITILTALSGSSSVSTEQTLPYKFTTLEPTFCVKIPHYHTVVNNRRSCEVAVESLYDHNHEKDKLKPVFVLLRNLHPQSTFKCFIVDKRKRQYIILPPKSTVDVGDPLTVDALRFDHIPAITCSEYMKI